MQKLKGGMYITTVQELVQNKISHLLALFDFFVLKKVLMKHRTYVRGLFYNSVFNVFRLLATLKFHPLKMKKKCIFFLIFTSFLLFGFYQRKCLKPAYDCRHLPFSAMQWCKSIYMYIGLSVYVCMYVFVLLTRHFSVVFVVVVILQP